MTNIEELQSQINGLLAITKSQTQTLKGLNENCWLLLERIQKIEQRITQLENPKPELEGFILSDLLSEGK